MMQLAGIRVPDDSVVELAQLLRDISADPTAETLENAVGRGNKIVALTIPDREAIIDALEDPPWDLEELRRVLLAEHVGRRRVGLV